MSPGPSGPLERVRSAQESGLGRFFFCDLGRVDSMDIDAAELAALVSNLLLQQALDEHDFNLKTLVDVNGDLSNDAIQEHSIG